MGKGKIIHSLVLHIDFKLITRLEIVFKGLPSSETMKTYTIIRDVGHLRPINSIQSADSDLSSTRYASCNLSDTQYAMGEWYRFHYVTLDTNSRKSGIIYNNDFMYAKFVLNLII